MTEHQAELPVLHSSFLLALYFTQGSIYQFSPVQSLSDVRLLVTSWTAACQASLWVCSNSCPLSWWCHPTISSSVVPFSSCLQSFQVFSNESVLPIRWPKYWSFSISPSNGYSELISFRMDWFDLLAVQGTLKSLLPYHSSKASALLCSASLSWSHPLLLLLCPHIHSAVCVSIPALQIRRYGSVQFSSVAQSCPTLCDPMNCSTPGLPVHHQLPEFTQTHIRRVSDAIQPSHPLLSPIPARIKVFSNESTLRIR